jgi:hypothetical protein
MTKLAIVLVLLVACGDNSTGFYTCETKLICGGDGNGTVASAGETTIETNDPDAEERRLIGDCHASVADLCNGHLPATCVAICEPSDDPPSDASPYPSCESLDPTCADPAKLSVVCASTGECYCDVDGRGPEPKVRCSL